MSKNETLRNAIHAGPIARMAVPGAHFSLIPVVIYLLARDRGYNPAR
jgi:hypothetical protein